MKSKEKKATCNDVKSTSDKLNVLNELEMLKVLGGINTDANSLSLLNCKKYCIGTIRDQVTMG